MYGADPLCGGTPVMATSYRQPTANTIIGNGGAVCHCWASPIPFGTRYARTFCHVGFWPKWQGSTMSNDSDRVEALETLLGVKFLQRLSSLLARLHDEARARDRAGNRELFYDHLCGLILLDSKGRT